MRPARKLLNVGKLLILVVAGLLAGLISVNAVAAELVMFDSATCPWCKSWTRDVGGVYPKTEEGRRAPLRRVDIHAPRPADLRHIEGVVYTPTFVLLDDGREMGRIVGYPGEDHFWGLLGELFGKLPPGAGSQAGPNS